MAFHAQNSIYTGSITEGHICHSCSRNLSLGRSLVAKFGEECTCAEEGDLDSPGSGSMTDYCAEVGDPCTPAGASIPAFSPFIVQSNEWAGPGQRSVHASPYSPCRSNIIDRSHSFAPGSRPNTQRLGTFDNQSLHLPTSNAAFHKKSEEIPSGEMAATGPEALQSNNIVPLAHAFGLGGIQNRRQASSDTVRRYLNSILGETTYGPAQDDRVDYTTEDSVRDDTSVYSQSSGASEDLGGSTYESSNFDQNKALAIVLEAAKCALIKQLMQEFWVRFDKDWMGKFTACAGRETTSIPASSQRASSSAQATAPKRQRRENGDDISSSDESGRAHKRSMPQQTPPEGEVLALSCPFRKYDSRKYRFPEHKTCALHSWNNVGRVKEHVYRYHRMPIHCARCWTVFQSKDLLDSHSRDETSVCPVRPVQVLDGITPDTERLLRSRKKEYRGQSEPEHWRKMYRTIFPNKIVPSPYYEEIRDENADYLGIYHEYMRREIPRLFRLNLSSVIDSQLKSIADTARTLLEEILQRSMNEAFINYRNDGATGEVTALQPAIAIRTAVEPVPQGVVHTHKQHSSINSIGSVPELQPTFDYLSTLDQSPIPPPTPGDPALPCEYFPAARDIHVDHNNRDPPLPNCFCPLGACNCPGRQNQAQFFPPAAFEFNTGRKTLEKRTLAEEWSSAGLLETADFGEDDFNID